MDGDSVQSDVQISCAAPHAFECQLWEGEQVLSPWLNEGLLGHLVGAPGSLVAVE